MNSLALRVRQPRQQAGLQAREHLLEEARDAGQDVDVAVDDGDGDPEVVGDEDDLVGVREGGVVGQLDHAQLGGLRGGVDVPVEIGVGGVGFAEGLHFLVRGVVQDEGQVEGARDALVGDVVVGGADAAGGDDEVVVGRHAAGGLDDFALVVGDDLDALEVDAEREAVFGEPGGVGVDGLGLGFQLSAFGCALEVLYKGDLAHLAAEHLVANDQTGCGVDHSLAPLLRHCRCSRACEG